MTPVEFRRHLHAFPELSFKEEKTARFIACLLYTSDAADE